MDAIDNFIRENFHNLRKHGGLGFKVVFRRGKAARIYFY